MLPPDNLSQQDVYAPQAPVASATEPEAVITLSGAEPAPDEFIQVSPAVPREVAPASSPASVQMKAQKAHFALGASSPGLPALVEQFWAKDDQALRDRVAIAEQIKIMETKQSLVSELTAAAAAEGRPLKYEDYEFINQLAQVPTLDRDTIIEKLYAKRAVETLTVLQDNSWESALKQATAGPKGEKAYNVMDAAEATIARQEIAHDLLRQIDDEYKSTSWSRWGYNTVKDMLPFYQSYMTWNVSPGIGTGAMTPGSNLEQQYEGLYLLPPEQFRQKAVEALNYLKQHNMNDAKRFAEGLVNYSRTQRAWDNALAIADATDVATLGAPLAAKALTRFATRMRSGVLVNANPNMQVADVLVAAGNIPAAAEQNAAKVMNKVATGSLDITDVTQTLPSMMDPLLYLRNAGSLSNERQRRLLETLNMSAANLTSATSRTTVMPRVVTEEAISKTFANAEKEWRLTYPNLVDSVLEVRPERLSEHVYGGVDRIVVYLGKQDATAFETAEIAEHFAKDIYRLTAGTYDIHNEASNFVIRMQKFVDETDLEVRNLRWSTDNQNPGGIVNQYLGWLRSPADIVSPKHYEARVQATYGGNQVAYYVKEAIKDIGAMSKTERDRVGTILRDNQTELRPYPQPDGTTKNLPGNRWETVGDLEAAYLRRFNQLPSDKEIAAYFKFQQINDWDLMMRNIGEWRDLVRQGAEQKSITFHGKVNGKSVQMTTPFFEARTVKQMPWSSNEPFTVGWVDETGKGFFKISTQTTRKERELIDDMVAKGHQILQPMNPRDEVLTDLVGARGEVVNYILGKELQTKPLSLDRIKPRYGGHIMHDENALYIKGPSLWDARWRRYQGGDVVLRQVFTPAQGEKFVAAYNTARQMLLDGAPDATLLSHLQRNTDITSVAEFKALFKENGGPFDARAPFALTRSGQRYDEVHDLAQTLRDRPLTNYARSEHNPMAQVHQKYLQERTTLDAISELGTTVAPIYQTRPAQALDPLEAMNRATRELVRNRFFDDYKHRTVEDWVSQFQNVLKGTQADIWANPMDSLKFPKWADNVDGAELAAAKNARRAILQLMGQTSPGQQQFNWAREKILDAAYKRGGIQRVETIEPWLWTETSDPIGMARGIVFHAKMGLWNVMQFPLQAQSVIHAAALDGNPARAIQANLAAWMMRAQRMGDYNPAFTTAMGRWSRKALGIPEDQYAEMYTALKRSGMMNVEGETAMLGDYFMPSLIDEALSGPGRRIWDSSKLFFAEGERYVRMTAFNTAYLAWRQANPTAKLTPKIEREILNRADTLSLNMTRAANNPALQQGPQSLMTQFMTYHARLSEQMLGGRLSAAEKARVMLTYSAMYGVPLGVGGTTLGAVAPVYDKYRTYALENGVDTSDWKMKAFLEGIPSLAMSALIGEDVNFAQRYGPGGMSFFRDLLDGKVEVLLGPSGNFIKDAISHSEPFTRTLLDLFDTQANDTFTVSSEDVLHAFREISTVNNLARGLFAFNYGKLITKNEMVVGDVDKKMAVWTMMTGMVPQDVSDAFLKAESNADLRKAQQQLEKEANIHFGRAIRAWQQGDIAEGNAHAKKARVVLTHGGYTTQQMADVMMRAFNQGKNKDFISKIGKDFVIKAPAEQQQQRLQQWQKQQMMQGQ